MKFIFTLLIGSLLTTSAFAYEGSRISITTAVKKDVLVYVDGRLLQEKEHMVVLNNVQPGNHSIRIYRKKNGNNKNAAAQGKLLYASTIYVRPSYHVDIMVNRFGKALVDEQAINNNNDRWDEDDDWFENDEPDYHQAISGSELNQLIERMRSQWFGRLGNAKDAIGKNYFRTSQVKQVIELFASENDKLELAKLSYRNIIDRQNFRQLYNLFSRNSQTELDRYVRAYRE